MNGIRQYPHGWVAQYIEHKVPGVRTEILHATYMDMWVQKTEEAQGITYCQQCMSNTPTGTIIHQIVLEHPRETDTGYPGTGYWICDDCLLCEDSL